jgi:hypothetical protein
VGFPSLSVSGSFVIRKERNKTRERGTVLAHRLLDSGAAHGAGRDVMPLGEMHLGRGFQLLASADNVAPPPHLEWDWRLTSTPSSSSRWLGAVREAPISISGSGYVASQMYCTPVYDILSSRRLQAQHTPSTSIPTYSICFVIGQCGGYSPLSLPRTWRSPGSPKLITRQLP